MRSIVRRPRAPSRRSPDAVMDPSGNASAAAISSRSGVSGVIFSGGGIEATAQQHMSMDHIQSYQIAAHCLVWLSGNNGARCHDERCPGWVRETSILDCPPMHLAGQLNLRYYVPRIVPEPVQNGAAGAID
jgi:hypothetical protein